MDPRGETGAAEGRTTPLVAVLLALVLGTTGTLIAIHEGWTNLGRTVGHP
jgi:hypothetical protein